MLVLIDESGDPGFKLVRGSSSHFVIAMVVFDDFAEAERTSSAIECLRTALDLNAEFKFSKCHDSIKDAFFDCVRSCRFTVRALVVDKSVVYSEGLRERRELFYNYFVKLLMAHDHGVLADARVKIDGSGDRRFKNELNVYLRRQLQKGQVRSIRFADSRRDNLIQLADMVSGAIYRSYRSDNRKHAQRWRQMLARAGRIGRDMVAPLSAPSA
jgi:hypothetical protein